jgi:phosphatidate cytidylyltransferase
MLKKRLITALWGIPLVIAAVWFDVPIVWFTVLAAVVGVLAGIEFYRMNGIIKSLPLSLIGLALILFSLISQHFLDIRYPSFMFSGIILILLPDLFLKKGHNPYFRWAEMLWGVFYIGLLLFILVKLRLDAGRNWVFLALFATFGSDTAAYFIGKAFGKHKMAPRISPNKTWEGAIAGLLGAVIISLLFTINTTFQLPFSYWQAIVLGLLISVFGQIGDLVESSLKRSFGVKDSGSLMPGHGGILDRIDSILFAGVVVYGYYFLVVA